MSKLLKSLFIGFSIFGLFHCSFAHPVDLQTAQSIAVKFMEASDAQLVSTYQKDKSTAAFYVFNTENGFVIVSADDCETPIIGYSHEGRFDPNIVPVQMEGYLQDFVARIQYGIENQVVADEATTKQWKLVKATGRLNDGKDIKAVPALLTSKWHQGCLYNSLCPEMSGPCDHAEVGCVAVAMAQIMRHHRYPANGWGSNFYTIMGTTFSANFGNTTYDWDYMPDSLTENSSEAEIEAVATLLYHCGVSVKMNYGTNGSNANSADVPNALMRFFDYSRQARQVKKSDFGDGEWMALLKRSIDSLQPVLYSGKGSGNIGHAFVCDGYDDNDLLHFNWGWGVADGYFALGNLNPLGLNLNNNHAAIIGIIPQYDPCVVSASVFPANAGTVEGTGGYHLGEQCTLTAVPAENLTFLFWKKNGQIVTYNTNYSFVVEDDICEIEAIFSPLPIRQVTASYAPDTNNPGCPYVSLSMSLANTQWNLLKQFESHGEWIAVSNGEHIYTLIEFYSQSIFGKYTMDGDFVEQFMSVEGELSSEPRCLAYDGNLFYFKNNNTMSSYGFRGIDMTSKTVVDSIRLNYSIQLCYPIQYDNCAYDPDADGFWFADYTVTPTMKSKLYLVNRSGQTIKAVQNIPDIIIGTGHFTAEDGRPYLLALKRDGKVFGYDIEGDAVIDRPLLSIEGDVKGGSVGKYDGKDALFVAADSTIRIYEINSLLAQTIGYRIYRACDESDPIVLADGITSPSFVDTTWNEVENGIYRYGVGSVYANGNESEVVWSNPIEKTDHGIGEHDENSTEPPVQKVFENGQIVIIKDGKRYTVTGQRLK